MNGMATLEPQDNSGSERVGTDVRVLIVEDSEEIAYLIKQNFAASNVEVQTHTNNFQLLLEPEVWANIDAVLLDLMLPGISGWDIAEYLTAQHPHIRIVILSAAAPFNKPPKDVKVHASLSKPSSYRDIALALGVDIRYDY